MPGQLGTLTVDLEANIARFERGLTRAERLMQKRTRKMQGIARTAGRLIGVGIGAALGGGLLRGAKRATDALSDVANTAEKLGLSTDALQEFRFAAEQVGVSSQKLDIGFQRFTRRSAEAATGSKELKKVFEQLGISLLDNNKNLRSNEDLFGDFIESLADVENQSERVRLAFKLLDTEGVDLVRLAGKFDELRKKARSMGVVIDASVIRTSRDAGDELKAMSTVIDAQLKPALVRLAPLLISITDKFANAAMAAADLWEAFFPSNIDPATLGEFETEIGKIETKIQDLFSLLSRGGPDVSDPGQLLTDPLKGIIVQSRGEIEKELVQLQRRLDSLNAAKKLIEGSGATPGAGEFKPPEPPGPRKETIQDITKELVQQNVALDAQINGWEDQFEVIEAVRGAQERLGATFDQTKDPAIIKALVQERQALEDEAEAAARLEAAYESLKNPADDLAQTMSDLQTLLDAGKISWETYIERTFEVEEAFESLGKTVETKTEEMSEFAIGAARNMQTAFADFLFDPFGDDLDDLVSNFATAMRRLAAETASAAIFDAVKSSGAISNVIGAAGSFFSAGSGGSAGGFTGTGIHAFANGGALAAGQMAVVGEKGPEFFIPKQPGTVIPNGMSPGGMVFNVSIQGQVDSRTGTQVGLDAARAFNMATARNG